ncbi:hypothetical protein C6N75_06585 [Streptomyces solincola]|uniref:DUF1232 domain-containing protein n=1 Tax=Streptomyces solincola TaxID=2100817 RepID=A0A2S9Q060_9ACTN|nr:YkvA family protein [Streptomyces solincola]PRH79983.1 hypothetical protein C6N75_06585 [Streptomyces solincola]
MDGLDVSGGLPWWVPVTASAAVVMAAAALWLLLRLFRARRLLTDAGVPLHGKALFWASVLYTVSPLDLLPDPFYLDDVGLLLLALRTLHSAAARHGVRSDGAGAVTDSSADRLRPPEGGKSANRL